MPIATIIGAIVAAGSTIASGILSARSQSEANQLNLALAREQSQAEATMRQLETQQAQQQLGLARKSLALQEKEAAANRAMQAEQTQYNRLQHAADKFAEYRNNKAALLQNRLSPLMRG